MLFMSYLKHNLHMHYLQYKTCGKHMALFMQLMICILLSYKMAKNIDAAAQDVAGNNEGSVILTANLLIFQECNLDAKSV